MNGNNVILLIEDREDDVLLIQRAFQQAFVAHPLLVVRSGEEAIAYLAGEGQYADRTTYPIPTLVLLDLKMPRIDGFEVLEWIRKHPWLNKLRVIVLTSSHDLRDVNRAYQMGANSFLIKSIDFEDVVRLGKVLTEYWLSYDHGPTTAIAAIPNEEDLKQMPAINPLEGTGQITAPVPTPPTVEPPGASQPSV